VNDINIKATGRLTDQDETLAADLHNVARDMRAILLELREVVKYMKDAESEVPEKMRRFIMYYHDVHDIWNLHHEGGMVPPKYLNREIERCHDRFRHLLDELYGDQGTFERVRQDMTEKGGNRYDYSRQLTAKDHSV
jgi:hypothetical protein